MPRAWALARARSHACWRNPLAGCVVGVTAGTIGEGYTMAISKAEVVVGKARTGDLKDHSGVTTGWHNNTN
jgi:hypothetical protein